MVGIIGVPLAVWSTPWGQDEELAIRVLCVTWGIVAAAYAHSVARTEGSLSPTRLGRALLSAVLGSTLSYLAGWTLLYAVIFGYAALYCEGSVDCPF